MGAPPKIQTRPLAPELWPQFEALFESAGGVCGGCWCTSWRLEKGDSYEQLKGGRAKARIRKSIASGKAHGILAFASGEPVGWCSFGRRADYPKLDRAPSAARVENAKSVWSIPCFFLKSGFRGRGVAAALLAAARAEIARLAKRGEVVEGYPENPKGKASAALIYTGTVSLFEKQGFRLVQRRPRGRQRVRAPARP